ncbi:MAG: rhodanese-like domain-containing protein [Nitrospirota bacterium]
MKHRIAAALIMVLLPLSFAGAQEFKDIRAEEVKKLIDRRAKMVIVDARTRQEYYEGHLPTAINVPPEYSYSINQFLPKDKDTLLIFYCRGIG